MTMRIKLAPRFAQSPAATCRHTHCHCPADAGDSGGYCCTYCSAADHTEAVAGGCACGHESCRMLSPHRPAHEIATSIGPL